MSLGLLTALEQAGVSTSEVIHEFSGNEALYIKHVLKFPSEKTIFQLDDAVQQKDSKRALETAHSMKGLSGCLGFKELYIASSEMVQLLRQKNEDEAYMLFAKVIESYAYIVYVISDSYEFKCYQGGN